MQILQKGPETMSNEKQLKDVKLTPGGRKVCSIGELHLGSPPTWSRTLKLVN